MKKTVWGFLFFLITNLCYAEIISTKNGLFTLAVSDPWKARESGNAMTSQMSVQSSNSESYMTIQFSKSREVEYQLYMEGESINEEKILEKIYEEYDQYILETTPAKKIQEGQGLRWDLFTLESRYEFPDGLEFMYLDQVFFLYKGEYTFIVSVWSASAEEQTQLLGMLETLRLN